MGRLFLFLLALPLATSAQDTAAHEACPCASYGPYPCAAITLVALADQADPLGLTDAQLDTLQALRDHHLRIVHEIEDDIASLGEMTPELRRPYDADEVFALFYDIGRHKAERDDAFRAAQDALLGVLDARQRLQWHARLDHAASLQEQPPPP